MSTVALMAMRIVDDAGSAGGTEEVRRLAERGWPLDRELDDDSPELRAAILDRARDVVRSADLYDRQQGQEP